MIKKQSLIVLVLLCASFLGFGQTTVTYVFDNYYTNAQVLGSGSIDANISFTTAKNLSSTDPTYYSLGSAARFYGHATRNGGSMTLIPGSGVTITSVVLTANSTSYDQPVAFNEDGGTDVSVNATSLIYTISGLSATSSLKFRNYINSTGQLRLTSIEVTYTIMSSCNISSSGLANTSCNDNSTISDALDDFITFDLDPAGSNLGATYSVSVSSGTITPNSGISYGSATSFTLQNGSAGTGDVTVTITDDTDGSCSFNQLITDPGSCNSGNCSELFISEYHEAASGDEKYIEIYNPTSSSIDLSNYQLAQYNGGSLTPSYTLALSGNLSSYSTYVIANNLGTYCPSADLCSNQNIMQFNGNDVMALQTSSGTNIDLVGLIGDVSNFAINVDLRRKSTVQSPTTTYNASDWDSTPANNVTDLGSHTSDCQGPTPELQLIDNTATNQNCGYTIDFGTQALSTNTDLTFDIKNAGSAILTINSFNITGSANFTLVSPPATPFDIASSGSQTITVRFTPTTPDGTKNATLTINNNDSNEGACTVDLTGEGYTPSPNIIVRGIIGSNPTIANGSTTAFGFNNTLFAQDDIGGVPGDTKGFRIGNESGTDVLNISSITLSGAGAGDFSVTANLSNPATNPIAINNNLDFTITFDPISVSGTRTALVTVVNSDSDKNPYTFVVEGAATCPSVSGSIAPIEGPVGTIVTITSVGNDLTGATAKLNGTDLTIISSSTTELVVKIPDTITVGGSINVELLTGCIFSSSFTLIDQVISSCQTSASATVDDLFISQVTDSPSGSVTYVELYNATGSLIDFALTNYSLRIYNNGSTSSYNEITINAGTVAQNTTFVIAMGSLDNKCTEFGGDGGLSQLQTTAVGVSINFHKNNNTSIGHDFIGLFDNTSSLIDMFGVFGDQTWALGLGLGESGANFERNTSATLPNPTLFSASDWNISNWNNCSETDYTGIGDYDFSTGVPPTTNPTSVPVVLTSCYTATISVTGQEGYDGVSPADTKELAYQWYYNVPSAVGWVEILNTNTDYTGQQAALLTILDTSTLEGYQYYCQIREDDQDCYTASDAVQLTLPTTTWTSGGWVPGAPDADTIAIIDYDYNTFTNGNIDACNLVVNDDGMGGLYTLTIANNSYVKVENNLIVNGKIIVNPKGSFVQVNDNGTVTVATQTSITVEKETAPMDAWYEYTYWSSPVSGETINLGLYESASDRRFWFNAQNYKDDLKENGNSGSYSSGQDDIDDNGDDWILVTNGNDTMIAGVGYASTHNKGIFNSSPCYTDNNVNTPCQFTYTFEGPFNNGVINVPVYRNDDEMADNNWNLIGNPYSSAIYVNDFLTVNAGVFSAVPLSPPVGGLNNGAIFIWSQASPPDEDNPGNQNQNFKQSDYAIINTTGQTAGGDGIIPSRYIPSGQSFFMAYDNSAVGNLISSSPDDIYEGNVVFNNSMRVTTNNDQFFRGTNSKSSSLDNKIWINLTSDNGVFNQLAIAYVDNATNGYDGMGYDTPRNLSTELYSSIYTIIEGEDKKFAIQGKAKGSLTLDESIPLGFDTSINVATLYTLSISQMEGEFLNNNTIYLKDYLMNIVHDLSNSEYTFTSEVGEFKERFEIVFTNASLSTNENSLADNTISIVELDSDNVRFKTSSNQTIKTVVIYDVLGRLLYNLNGNSSSETYNLSSLSQATYIAKVELSNGLIITKKAIKRK